ncbi:MAG: serine hydrolase domain-containing protein [Bacteroidota bacterium]
MKRNIFLRRIILLQLFGLLYLPFQSTAQGTQATVKDDLDTAIEALMEKHNIPGLSIAFMKDALPGERRTYGSLQKGQDSPINEETVFSVGSVSKVGNAILTLKLVNEGKLDLDEDVNTYLKSWKVEQGPFNAEQAVTLRHLLSHTAGFSVHGFADYYPGAKLPETTQILDSKGPAKNAKVKLIFPVGSKFKYSGGGITVIQQIIEDVTGLTYHEAAETYLFKPLGLERSSFENPLPETFGNIAKAHNKNGKAVALPRGYQAMPEKAASGLWTSPSDLLKMLSAVMQSEQGSADAFLSPEIVKDMIDPEQASEFGLGPKIAYRDDYHIVEHGGSNESYKAQFTLFWKKKSGYAIFTNGSYGTRLIRELEPILEKYLMK